MAKDVKQNLFMALNSAKDLKSRRIERCSHEKLILKTCELVLSGIMSVADAAPISELLIILQFNGTNELSVAVRNLIS